MNSSATVATTELVDSTCGVDHTLLTRVERMAGRTDLHVKVLTECGSGLEGVAATAVHRQRVIRGVDFRLHGVFLKRMRPN